MNGNNLDLKLGIMKIYQKIDSLKLEIKELEKIINMKQFNNGDVESKENEPNNKNE